MQTPEPRTQGAVEKSGDELTSGRLPSLPPEPAWDPHRPGSSFSAQHEAEGDAPEMWGQRPPRVSLEDALLPPARLQATELALLSSFSPGLLGEQGNVSVLQRTSSFHIWLQVLPEVGVGIPGTPFQLC